MRPIEKEGASVIMLGSFNPSIFQPSWFAAHQLIRVIEAETATITIIQAQVADFQTDWFRLQVLQNRFLLQSLDATHYGPLRDIVAGAFRLLPHTPVSKMAIARWFHFAMDNVELWHEVGHKLAPKDLWHPFMDSPGLRSLLMQGYRKGAGYVIGSGDGVLFVKIEPSLLVQPGVFVEITEEMIPPKSEGNVTEASWVLDRLDKQWEPVMEYAEAVSQGLLAAVLKS